MIHRIADNKRYATIFRHPLVLALLLSLLFGAAVLATGSPQSEVRELSQVSWDAERYKEYFSDLAKRKGPVYAFAVLRDASIAPGVDTHSLGHEIGYVLYDQKGGTGLAECTDHYSPACAHTIVTEEFIHQGPQAVARLTEACSQKESGTYASSDCFHGMGHGVLANAAYDYEEAIQVCTEVKDLVVKEYPRIDAVEAWRDCVDGVTMELLQGFHDKAAWEKQRPRYLPESDLLMPCNASFMPAEVQASCYIYTRTRLVISEGKTKGDNSLQPELHERAFRLCDLIPEEEVENRRTCYGGFGIYFVFMVNNGDDRVFGQMNTEQLKTLHTLCALGPHLNARSACTLTAAGMTVSRGTGLRAAAEFCALTPDPVLKERCYPTIIDVAWKYAPVPQRLCGYLPQEYKAECAAPKTS